MNTHSDGLYFNTLKNKDSDIKLESATPVVDQPVGGMDWR